MHVEILIEKPLIKMLERRVAVVSTEIACLYGKSVADAFRASASQKIRPITISDHISLLNASGPQAALHVATLSKARAAQAILVAELGIPQTNVLQFCSVKRFAMNRFALLEDAATAAGTDINRKFSAALSRGELLPLLLNMDATDCDESLCSFCKFHFASQILVDSFVRRIGGRRCILTTSPLQVCHNASKAAVDLFQASSASVNPPVEVVVRFSDDMKSQTIAFPEPILSYVVLEIVKNALQSTERFQSQEPVELVLASDDMNFTVEIRDYGHGVEEHNEQSMWRLGWSTSRSLSPLSGSGLGLPLSKIYVELFGGALHHTRMSNDSGCKFILRLPVRAAESFPQQFL